MIISEHGSHAVDYSLDLPAMLHVAGYDSHRVDKDMYVQLATDSVFNHNMFPITRNGQMGFEHALFGFNRKIESGKTAAKLIMAADSQNPWMPAKIENMLSFGTQRPELQLRNPIAAVGSVGMIDEFELRDLQFLDHLEEDRRNGCIPHFPLLTKQWWYDSQSEDKKKMGYGSRELVLIRYDYGKLDIHLRFLAIRKL